MAARRGCCRHGQMTALRRPRRRRTAFYTVSCYGFAVPAVVRVQVARGGREGEEGLAAIWRAIVIFGARAHAYTRRSLFGCEPRSWLAHARAPRGSAFIF